MSVPEPVSSCATIAASVPVELRIPADAEFVRVARLTVAAVASRLALSYEDIEDLKLAVAEACNNAILYGERDGAAPTQITVTCEVVGDNFVVSVFDCGEGWADRASDMRAADARRLGEPPDELTEGGLGLYLLEALMDEVRYEPTPDGGTTVHLVKRIPG